MTALRIALVKLLEHTLRGMFDGPSTVAIDWSTSPGVVIDLSSVFGNADALPLVQMTTNTWLADQMTDLPRQGRRGILVEDEVWATAGSERAAKTLQARLKLCRLYGIWNILLTHRLSDLRAQADDGSSAAKVAEDLLGDIGTRVVFRQAIRPTGGDRTAAAAQRPTGRASSAGCPRTWRCGRWPAAPPWSITSSPTTNCP